MTMTTPRTGMSLAEYRADGGDNRFEIINGKRKNTQPEATLHSDVRHNLYKAIFTYSPTRDVVEASMQLTFVRLDPDDRDWIVESITPDVSVYMPERMRAYEQTNPDYKDRPCALIPDFVAEVIAPDDFYSDVDEKIDTLLAVGVRVIWIIDPQLKKVSIHTYGSSRKVVIKGDAALDGGDVLPGFWLPLSELFK